MVIYEYLYALQKLRVVNKCVLVSSHFWCFWKFLIVLMKSPMYIRCAHCITDVGLARGIFSILSTPFKSFQNQQSSRLRRWAIDIGHLLPLVSLPSTRQPLSASGAACPTELSLHAGKVLSSCGVGTDWNKQFCLPRKSRQNTGSRRWQILLQSRARESGEPLFSIASWICQLFQIWAHRPPRGPTRHTNPTTHSSSVYRPKTPTFLHARPSFCAARQPSPRECCPAARPGVAEICNSALALLYRMTRQVGTGWGRRMFAQPLA